MIDSPGQDRGVDLSQVHLRPIKPAESEAVQAVWERSLRADDPAPWPPGGRSLVAWATRVRVLEREGQLVGVVAVRAERAPDGAMPARVGLDVSARQPALAEQLVHGAADLVREAEGDRVRLYASGRAEWSREAAGAAGFEHMRTIAHMLLPADAPTPATATQLPGLTVRSIRKGEDRQVLAALNRSWKGTWNFVQITFEMLRRDLQGQRKGMLLAVTAEGSIVATCHAVFDPTDVNPDDNPRAWISNLTVAPDYRGRGVARAMLAMGIAHLRERGASSITLGVDAHNPAPFTLYKSVGFQMVSSVEAWDKLVER